jgi:4,5-DOPA dioxygenase extradiol
MQTHAGPAHAYRVGQALAPLAAQGIWILASGNLTHNLGDWHRASANGGQAPAYVQRFTDWVAEQLDTQNLDALLNYRALSAEGRQAHPSEDHFLPLFVALGAAGPQAKAQAFFRGISHHVIAMDGYAFTPPTGH